ncbi:MAG TPA: 16S rRNA (cytosine(1402)-N(4))-methyltransferase RsmH [Candidatus Saccharimonadales bacterium]|nr:16S rRNA (cytosine(1402)-N(4))-methyltransferase RsmH [Candidatus Saccharimonadales bacterium]
MHQNKNQNTNQQHEPVLLNEVLQILEPQPGDTYLDLTAGYGGHALAILERTGSLTPAVLIDRDPRAITALKQKFAGKHISIRQLDFLSAARELLQDARQFDLILADLGVSSPLFNDASRGFAISKDGPLDMRMDPAQGLTAATIVNSYSQPDLIKMLKNYGEEPKAKQIAEMIVANRPINSTVKLAEIVARAWPGRSRLHPATRTFQALRIAVNDELHLLEQSLPLWLKLLTPGGRIAIISFHSLEDRLVKNALQSAAGDRYDAELRLLTKRPITSSKPETVFNPRARSAKLRAAVKIKKKGNAYADSGKKQLPSLQDSRQSGLNRQVAVLAPE